MRVKEPERVPISTVSSNFTPLSAVMAKSDPMSRLLFVVYRAAEASWLTLLSLTSLSVRPLAVTFSAYFPWGATLMAPLKKEALIRLVEEL